MRLYYLLLLIALSLPAVGCVSKSSYNQKADEAEALSESVRSLEVRNLELQSQRESLVRSKGEVEDQLAEAMARISALQQDLLRSRADLDRIEKVLSARSAEAGAALAEMRQTIDRLQDENRRLAAQVEQERIAREARIAQMRSTYDELVQKMEAEIQRGEITISELQGRLTVNMVEKILFDTGRAEVKLAGLEVLRRVGNILKEEKEREIRIEGHTDNVPISPRLQETFPTNWELSTARATNVVHFLQGKVGIPGDRLSAAGYGEFRPVASNGTSEGRAQNRRIQIILVPLEPKQ